MTAALFQETDLRSEPWALLQVDSESRLVHKAIVIDVNQALDRILSAGIAIVSADVVAGGAMWFERYGLNVSLSEAPTEAGMPLFLVLWKQAYVAIQN
jgi:hypothetical protein